MSLLANGVVAVLAGAAGGGVVAVAWWTVVRRTRPESTATQDEADSVRLFKQLDKDIGLVLKSIGNLSEKLERVLEEASTALNNVAAAGANARAQTSDGRGSPTHFRQPVSAPPQAETYSRSGESWPSSGTLLDTTATADAGAASSDLGLMSDPLNPAGEWDSSPSTPSPNSTPVEARDDRIVATSTYPPEAWLEPGSGPAERRLLLNSAVSLNENAMRRLRTFFWFDGERVGSRYRTTVPATIRWDDSQRVGMLIARGEARPLF